MPLRILVVGPKYASPDSRGGMATLIGLMRDRDGARARITTVATYVDRPTAPRWAIGVLGMVHSAVLVLAGRVDVLHVHLAHGGSVLRKSLPLLAARARGVPAVVHAHSYDFAGWFDGLPAAGQAVVRALLPADRWLVLGTGIGDSIAERLRLDPARVSVLRNPVQVPVAVPARNATRVTAVALGRLGRRKGSYDIVAALARLDPAVLARLEVVLAGDGEFDEVTAAVAGAGLADVVTVRSWIGPDERDALLARSEIFLLPSYEEGLPMALLEAMAWGLAPVTSPVGGIPEVVADGVDALLVDPGDVPALAAAIEALTVDPARRREIAGAARATATGYDVEAWFDELVTVWTDLAGHARRR